MAETKINANQTNITAASIGALESINVLPTASASNVGTIAQYAGATVPDTPESATIAQTTGSGLYDLSVNTTTFVQEEQPEGAETVDFTFTSTENSVNFTTVESLEMSVTNATRFLIYMSQKLDVSTWQVPKHGTFWTYGDDDMIFCGVNPGTDEEEVWFDDTISDMSYFTISGIQAEDMSIADYDITLASNYWTKDGEWISLESYGVSYNGAPANGDVITVSYTPKIEGVTHGYVYESSAVYSDPTAVATQTVGNTLNGLAVNVETFESVVHPVGDTSMVFVYKVTESSVEFTTVDSLELSIGGLWRFMSFISSQMGQWGPEFENGVFYTYDDGGDVFCGAEFDDGDPWFVTTVSDMEQAGFTVSGISSEEPSIASYSVKYGTNTWTQNDTDVNLDDYGITYQSGYALANDEITVTYTASAPAGYGWERIDVQPSSGGASDGIEWKTSIDLSSSTLPYDQDIYPVYTIEGGLPAGTYEVYYKVKTGNNARIAGSMTTKITFYTDGGGYVHALVSPVVDGQTDPTLNKYLYNTEQSGASIFCKKGDDVILFPQINSMQNYFSSNVREGMVSARVPKCFELSAIKNLESGQEYIATGEIYEDQDTGSRMSGETRAFPLIPAQDIPDCFKYGHLLLTEGIGIMLEGLTFNFRMNRMSECAEVYVALKSLDDEFIGRVRNVADGYEVYIEKATGVFEDSTFGHAGAAAITIKYNGTAMAPTDYIVGFYGCENTAHFNVRTGHTFEMTEMPALKIGTAPALPRYLGRILQYTDATNANYTNGYFYKATGTVSTTPGSIDCTETSGYGKTITMDVDGFIETFYALRPDIPLYEINARLSSDSYVFSYNADSGTLTWGDDAYDPTHSAALMQHITISPAPDSGEVIEWQTSNYVKAVQTVQNGAWTQVNTQPSSASSSTTATLSALNWSSNTQTVNVSGVTTTNVVFVSPIPADQADYTAAGILCVAQGTGTLTFTCDTVPSGDIDVTVVMI